MDYQSTGNIIKNLRKERGFTQKELALKLNISEQAVSKWERGVGMPDIAIITELSLLLGTTAETLLSGASQDNSAVSGNLKKMNYYVCEKCGNISVCTGNASVLCCNNVLKQLTPIKAEEKEKLMVNISQDDWHITSNHPMTKDNYISFLAFVTGEVFTMYKLYPEWDLSVTIPKRRHGTLVWYSKNDGLLYQYI